MSASTASTESPAPRATARNARSPQTSPVRRPRAAPDGADGGGAIAGADTAGLRRRDLERADLHGGLLHQPLRQACVAVGRRERLAVRVDVLEERPQRLALRRAGLLLVHHDPR